MVKQLALLPSSGGQMSAHKEWYISTQMGFPLILNYTKIKQILSGFIPSNPDNAVYVYIQFHIFKTKGLLK